MCNAYYQCANGHQYPDQFCPGDLLFNGEVCDHPQNVTCPITENESCSSEERIWYGDSEIAKVSTDAGKWEENPKKTLNFRICLIATQKLHGILQKKIEKELKPSL